MMLRNTRRLTFAFALLLVILLSACACSVVGNDSDNGTSYDDDEPSKFTLNVVIQNGYGESTQEIEHLYYNDEDLKSAIDACSLGSAEYGYHTYGYFTERDGGGMPAFDAEGKITEEYKNYILANKPESVTIYYHREPMDATLTLICDEEERVYNVKMFETVDLAELYVPEKLGYKFLGWTAYYDQTITVDELDPVYYARFEPLKITTKLCDPVEEQSDYFYIDYGSTYTANYKEHSGYNFVGYFSKENGEGTQYTDKNGNSLAPWSILNEKDDYETAIHIPLYAHYIPAEKYTVRVNNDGLKNSFTVTYMDAYQQAEGRAPVERSTSATLKLQYITPRDIPEGCYFAGWYTDKKFSHKFDFSQPVTSDLTLYPRFEKYPDKVIGSLSYNNCETYVTANGSDTVARKYVVAEDTTADISISASAVPEKKTIYVSIYNSTKGKYILSGALTNADLIISISDTALSVGDELTLSVTGEGDPQSVRFMFYGFTEPVGTYAVLPEYFEYDVTNGNSYQLDVFPKYGYEFQGYYTKPNGEGTKVTDENGKSIVAYDFESDIKLYPYYKEKKVAS